MLLCIQLALSRGQYSDAEFGFESYRIKKAIAGAESYIRQSETASTNLGCKTWIIVTEGNESQAFIIPEEIDTVSRSYVFVNSPQVIENLNREHTLAQLLNPLYSGPLHHIAQCQVVFVISLHPPDETKKRVNYLADAQLARVHKDYFFFFGIPHDVTESMQSAWPGNIRYKYFVNYEGNASVLDGCNDVTTGAPPSLFTARCDSALGGKKFLVTSVFGTPWCRLKLGSDGEVVSADGIYVRLLTDAAGRYNYTFKLKYAKGGGASGFKRHGLWFGAVGEVYEKTADIAFGCAIASNRDPVIDNGVTFDWMARVFFIQLPPLETNWKAMFRPFQPLVWLLISSTGFFMTPVYYFSLKWWRWRDSGFGKKNLVRGTHLLEVMKPLIAIHFEQSSDRAPFHGSRIRFLITSFLVFCMVMGAGFRSGLIYFLTCVPPKSVPETHADLLDWDYMILFRFYGGVEFPAESSDAIQREIAQRALVINSSSQDCIVGAILTGGSACLDWEPHGSFAVYTNATMHADQSKSLMIKSKDAMMKVLVAWVYKKWSPLTSSFDAYITKSIASGLYTKWQMDDFAENKRKGARWQQEQVRSPVHEKLRKINHDDSSAPKPLQLSALVGVFGLVWFGLLSASLCRIVQLCLRCNSRQPLKLRPTFYLP